MFISSRGFRILSSNFCSYRPCYFLVVCPTVPTIWETHFSIFVVSAQHSVRFPLMGLVPGFWVKAVSTVPALMVYIPLHDQLVCCSRT